MKRILIAVMLLMSIVPLTTAAVHAQSPSEWQASATGLRTDANPDGKTGGLGFTVRRATWPVLSVPGGVKDVGWEKLVGPVGIELGSIQVPGASPSFTGESADWAHTELTYNGGQLKLLVSRLTPALAVQSSANALRLFTGGISGGTTDGARVSPYSGPALPKYVAYSAGGNVQVASLGGSPLSLSSLDTNWVLLWYGGVSGNLGSRFVDTKTPMSYSGDRWDNATLPHSDAYQADVPILVVFQNRPASITHAGEGGVEISFSGASGYVTLLPLFGRNVLRSSETEGWGGGLPTAVAQKAAWWASRLCSFPRTVTEGYAYDAASDTATITENITYETVCNGGTRLAPVPPMLGVVKDALGVAFSGAVVDGGLPTEFGPSMGIENVASYSWSVSGLKGYVDAKRVTGSGQVPAELAGELAAEVNKIINAGHLAPWVFMDHIPRWESRGDLYWANPGDVLYHLSEIATALPADLRGRLVEYMRAERSAYPPEDVYDMSLLEGTRRGNFSFYGGSWEHYWTKDCSDCRTDAHYARVPLYNFYGLSRYYQVTGETPSSDVMGKAKGALNSDMKEQDWATLYWYDGFGDFYSHPQATANASRHFAGLIGFTRLAKMAGDAQAESQGRALLAKAAALRLGMTMYPRYLYAANLVQLPGDPAWQPKYNAGGWTGFLFNYDWTEAYDDARVVSDLSQFETDLNDSHGDIGDGYLIGYRDMVPETARLLGDRARRDAEIFVDKAEAVYPQWYVAFSEATIGQEHGMSHPLDSFQLFMAKAWLKNESGDKLARYADTAWLEAGDLFYVQKLAEAAMAYRGVSWDVGTGGGTPPPPPTPADGIATMNGKVTLQGRPSPPDPSWVIDLSVTLTSPGEAEPRYRFAPTTSESGGFSVGDIATGTYVVTVKGSGTLRSQQTVTLNAGPNDVDLGTLREGDANGDDLVSLLDFSLLATAFTTCEGDTSYDGRVDFNGDRCVTTADYSLLSSNFGQSGPGTVAAAVAETTAAGSVVVAVSPQATRVGVGDTFDVVVEVQAGDQPLDGAAIYLDFAPNLLQVLSVTPGDRLPTVIQSSHDNEAGRVDYVAGHLEGGVSGTFTLATLTFRAMERTPGTRLNPGAAGVRTSDVTYGGVSILDHVESDQTVTIQGTPGLQVRTLMPLFAVTRREAETRQD